jgi:hypothetical protein
MKSSSSAENLRKALICRRGQLRHGVWGGEGPRTFLLVLAIAIQGGNVAAGVEPIELHVYVILK